MSTTIIPDIYRHTARKSTVSRNVKNSTKTISLCNSTYNIEQNCKEEQTIYHKIQCNIKLEEDIPPQQEQTFIILPDNEIEQMNIEQTNEEIIFDIIEQIKNQIPQYFNNQIQNLNQREIISTDIHDVIDYLIDHIDTTINDVQMEDTNQSLHEEISMKNNSQSQINDDIVEIEVPSSSSLCNCQCHRSTSNTLLINPTNEYILFEQILQQTRQEQQHEQSLNNNHLIKTLKRQHQELLNLYHRQLHINKTDREQQTIKINQNDSQIQTDLTNVQEQQNQKSNIPIQQTNGTHSTPNLKGLTTTAAVVPRPFNSFLTPIRTTGPSLQQLIPCLTTTTTATTTTITNKTSMIKKTTTINSHVPTLPSSSTATNSHDIVDLTEEDDDNHAKAISAQKVSPLKTQQNLTSVPIATAGTARNQNRPIRSNNTGPFGQIFSFRPLPEHNSCDHTITRPQLSITHDNTTVRLTWNLPSTPMEAIQNYEIYAYKQNATLTLSDWRKIGNVNSMRLPMAVTLKEFQSNSHYAFAVRAVSINNNIGPFCEPKTIFTGNTLNTNSIVDSSTA